MMRLGVLSMMLLVLPVSEAWGQSNEQARLEAEREALAKRIRVDRRTDVYSLGATLFQLTIGRLPFEPGEDDDVLRQHVMERLSSPELKGRGHSAHLRYFIEKMMAKDADLRYQSWEELLEDMRAQVEGARRADFKGDGGRRGRG